MHAVFRSVPAPLPFTAVTAATLTHRVCVRPCLYWQGGKPVQVIPLAGCRVVECPEEEFDRPNVFLIESMSWVKKGKDVNSSRTFYLQAASREQAEEWIFLIQVCRPATVGDAVMAFVWHRGAGPRSGGISFTFACCDAGVAVPIVFLQLTSEKGEMERRRSTMSPGGAAALDDSEDTSGSDAAGPPSSWKLLAGNQIVISPVSCRHLLPAKYHGPTHPFVVCSLEKSSQVCRVASVGVIGVVVVAWCAVAVVPGRTLLLDLLFWAPCAWLMCAAIVHRPQQPRPGLGRLQGRICVPSDVGSGRGWSCRADSVG